MSIAANLAQIHETIRAAGRKPEEITLIGAAKYQPIERIREAIRAGLKDIGDNQLQAGESLREQLKEAVQWHFIGHIQSRKAKGLIDYSLIHSLERLKVAEILQRSLESTAAQTLNVLVEINVGEESTKSGIAASELKAFLKALAAFDRLKPLGLMCMPPPLNPVEGRRPFFRTLRRLAEENHLSLLSMGTSEDYAVAVEEGATHVRVGSCLFGERVR
ncbi:MAG: YggS family pyridoxal phosphate-dependent enzyme [Bdellovibrionota bacterium]